MTHDDFRYVRRGKQLSRLNEEDMSFLNPVHISGQGKEHALLILHGFSSSPAVYRFLIPQIKKYDAILCPVLSGHGESIQAFSQSKAQDWQETASKACEQLMNEYKKVDVLGLSLGGVLACELSQKYSLNHLYLLAPALRLHLRFNITTMIKLAHLLKYLGFNHIRSAGGNLLNKNSSEIAYRKLPLSAIIELLTFVNQYQFRAPTCPVDLFLGTFDEVVDSQEVEKFFVNLSNVNLHWLKNSAHVLPLDNDMQEIVNCINKAD